MGATTKEKQREYHQRYMSKPGNLEKTRERNKLYARERRKDPEVREKHRAAEKRRGPGRHIQRRYGLTLEDKIEMVRVQGGCAICLRELPLKQMRVDHDHRTGLVRQILCNGCNAGVGFFRENPDALRRAASYVELWQGLHELLEGDR